MKRIFLLIPVYILFFSSCEKEKAEVSTPCITRPPMSINVIVKDYAFVPATINVIPGDTVIWTWQQGMHTTTSISVPAGAAGWDAPIDDNSSSNHTFKYVIPVSGNYNYDCTIHGSSMSGTIIASSPC